MKNAILIFISAITTVSAQLLMRSAMIGIGDITSMGLNAAFYNIITNIKLWLALFSYAVSMLSFMALLGRMEISSAFPITNGLVYISLMVFAAFIFHESVTPLRMIGTMLIFVGGVLIIRS
ncbi:hypothetical protein FACS189487_07280 [Campylobacterota bacterium]|nr:hypothetical protein FACS189487_07280 [Campylobacterota bacterium]